MTDAQGMTRETEGNVLDKHRMASRKRPFGKWPMVPLSRIRGPPLLAGRLQRSPFQAHSGPMALILDGQQGTAARRRPRRVRRTRHQT